MMRSIPQALCWEMVARGKWIVPTCFSIALALPMLIYSLLPKSPVHRRELDNLIATFELILFPMVVFILGIGLLHAQDTQSRLYAKPISSGKATAWNMILGGTLMAMQFLIVACLLNYFADARWAIVGPTLISVAAWCSMQPLIHTVHKTFWGTVLQCLPVLALFIWWPSHYGAYEKVRHGWSQVSALDIFIVQVLVLVSFAFTVWYLRADRCGEKVLPLGFWNDIVRWWENLDFHSRRKLTSFRNGNAAQFWCEWRQKGWATPLGLLLCLGFITIACFCKYLALGRIFDSEQEFCNGLLSTCGVLLFVGAITGIFSGISQTSVDKAALSTSNASKTGLYQMGSFLATRPLTDRSIAISVLKTCAANCGLGWLLWVAFFFTLSIGELGLEWIVNFSTTQSLGLWFFVFLLALSWAVIANIAVIGLTGRSSAWFVFFSGVTGLCCLSVVVSGLNEFWWLRPYLDRIYLTICWVVTIALLLLCVGVFAYAVKNKAVNNRSLVLAVTLALSVIISAPLMIPTNINSFGVAGILVLAAASAFPLATGPLAVAWNRHR